MKDKEVKKRAWVKNAVIVFLAVMLVLTFFSNTIMNRSLPEVAAQYTNSGSITTRIRGTGTVEAVANFPVKLQQTRTIKDVNVRVGNEVMTGDILFTLADIESEELGIAQKELDALLLTLEKMILNTSLDGNYARDSRTIQLARNELADAQRDLTDLPYSEAAISAAQTQVNLAKSSVASAETRVAAEKISKEDAGLVVEERQAVRDTALSELGTLNNVDTTALRNEISDTRTQRINKETELNTTRTIYSSEYSMIESGGISLAGAATWTSLNTVQKSVYMNTYAQSLDGADPNRIAYELITGIESQLSIIRATLTRLDRELQAATGSDNSEEYNRRKRRYDDAEKALAAANTLLVTAQRALASAETALDDAKTALLSDEEKLETQLGYKNDWQNESKNIKNLQMNIENLLFDLAEKQRSDGVAGALSGIDIREMRKEIDEKREKIEKLEEGDIETTVTAPVSGVVTKIDISPGDQAEANAPLMMIEVIDRGYTLNIPVTVEQSRRVVIGDNAEVNRGYFWWGGEIRAVLAGIKTDPQNPAQSRLLEFDIFGDIESGTQLSITLGQRSESYEVIVPNSAVREDTNGNFVLVVLARSSPLGNRYIATRVDVTVLASDDTNSAVAGGLSSWGDFVITTSTAPIEPGMQVRLVDNPW